jgi:hypothetical protein
MIAALLTAGCVSVPVRDEVPLVTIAEIHQDPWAWDGRRVLVEGVFGLCTIHGCSTCETLPQIVSVSVGERIAELSRTCGGTSFVLGTSPVGSSMRLSAALFETEIRAQCASPRSRPGADGADIITLCFNMFVDVRLVEFREHYPMTRVVEPAEGEVLPLRRMKCVPR